MLTTRTRSIVTATVVLEVGIAGWALGYGWLWLLVMTAALTLAETGWGILRRHALGDLAGLQVALALALLLVVAADLTFTLMVAACCVAWLARPRQPLAPAA
ncbi:MAG: hypothetical protein QOG02_1726 [Gaiellales bacterium]|jgi:hypothetical protein|nr:hypothetical protein [Gaiellales bacterium]MDX6545952.1 hypothetical protein [Gaiellales bacterium]